MRKHIGELKNNVAGYEEIIQKLSDICYDMAFVSSKEEMRACCQKVFILTSIAFDNSFNLTDEQIFNIMSFVQSAREMINCYYCYPV